MQNYCGGTLMFLKTIYNVGTIIPESSYLNVFYYLYKLVGDNLGYVG